jgi:hypothetical protein
MRKHHGKCAPVAPPAPARPATIPEPAAAAGEKDRCAPVVSEEAIRCRAFQKWEAAGKPAGDGLRFWLEAEQELKQAR